MMKPTVAVRSPEVSDLGPAMLALSDQQRRFVVAYVMDSRDATRCAGAAGYEATGGSLRVRAHRLMHNARIIAAIKEEADKRLNGAAYIAVSGLTDIAADPEHRDRQKACDSILDRTGFPRREVRTVEPVDDDEYRKMPTSKLLDMIRTYAIKNFPDLCQHTGNGAIVVDIDKAQERVKARVVAELLSRNASAAERRSALSAPKHQAEGR